ncbi:hypothetical protein Rsub_07922 [Raphidocelis subcapitata]|uniref:Uncharacterized protein n=1 Tax=Raphidocelis subcapitata TaxID=307507 RepID=A0A2V0PDG3_9CHLO|nr:hypothetical protein Rsub_07922 [Raphidocelis subcapitata]|eukprot:GBF95207.1 hypothetical protein Rsub_07922 [Raphidocelis subcapitata]
MTVWEHDEALGPRNVPTPPKSRGSSLLGVAGLCGAFWALILTGLLDQGGPTAWHTAGGPGGAAAFAPQLEAHVSVAGVDPSARAADLAVELAGRSLPLAPAGAAHSTLRLRFGGVSEAVAWPQRAQRASFSARAPLEEVVPHQLRPFDAYALRLGPLSAVLTTCDGGDGGDGDGDGCVSVALPVRLTLDGAAARGFKFAARPAGGAAAPCGAAAAVDELLITRATSQRVLRLTGIMLQWLLATYALAMGAGAVACRLLLARCVGRAHGFI